MKNYLSILFIAFFVCSLNAKTEEKDNTVELRRDICNVLVTADCDGDGILEYSGVVDCENADVLVDELQDFCDNSQ